MRSCLIIMCFFIISTASIAQVNYDASKIPKALLPYSSAVVRNKVETIEVKALDNTIYHIKAAITVLNKNGNNLAQIVIWHNKSNVLKSVRGVVYDADGKQINKFSESDFADEDAANDFSLFEDSRVKHYIPAAVEYPYTIEYEYEVRSKQSLNFQDWKPNPTMGMAIEKSSFTFICKPDFNIHFKEINLPEKVKISTNADGLKTYAWQIDNLKAIKEEPYSPDSYNYTSSVKIAPEKFNYGGLNGSFTNWNELGKWIYDKLLINRDQLSPEAIAYVTALVKDITDPKKKAQKIYEYMQQKTHYISVQIGIGGYQPFQAAEVDKLGYGDCKALVNYMQALLKIADINSYYCVVEAGGNKTSMLTDFASMGQGNHVILCLPFKNDTTWVECTNQKIPFGFLGDFTDDRIVLACTAQGGLLLHTPKYAAQNNLQIRQGSFKINESGELYGSMETLFKGLQYDNRESLTTKSYLEQVKDLKYIYAINNMDIEQFNIIQDKSLTPVTTENLKFKARDYAAVNAGKLNFMINPVNRTTHAPREIRNRLTDVYINEGYTDDDEINYTIPKGYHIENEPLNITISKPFGNYTATVTIRGDQLIYKRKIQLLNGTYSRDSYDDLVSFYQSVVDADNYNIIMVK